MQAPPADAIVPRVATGGDIYLCFIEDPIICEAVLGRYLAAMGAASLPALYTGGLPSHSEVLMPSLQRARLTVRRSHAVLCPADCIAALRDFAVEGTFTVDTNSLRLL